MIQETEGKLVIDDAGHEIYYRLFGSGEETLVGLHGGPGADQRYLTRLSELSSEGVQVLLYDQLGSGKWTPLTTSRFGSCLASSRSSRPSVRSSSSAVCT